MSPTDVHCAGLRDRQDAMSFRTSSMTSLRTRLIYIIYTCPTIVPSTIRVSNIRGPLSSTPKQNHQKLEMCPPPNDSQYYDSLREFSKRRPRPNFEHVLPEFQNRWDDLYDGDETMVDQVPCHDSSQVLEEEANEAFEVLDQCQPEMGESTSPVRSKNPGLSSFIQRPLTTEQDNHRLWHEMAVNQAELYKQKMRNEMPQNIAAITHGLNAAYVTSIDEEIDELADTFAGSESSGATSHDIVSDASSHTSEDTTKTELSTLKIIEDIEEIPTTTEGRKGCTISQHQSNNQPPTRSCFSHRRRFR